jgi:hypothetical protein
MQFLTPLGPSSVRALFDVISRDPIQKPGSRSIWTIIAIQNVRYLYYNNERTKQ